MKRLISLVLCLLLLSNTSNALAEGLVDCLTSIRWTPSTEDATEDNYMPEEVVRKALKAVKDSYTISETIELLFDGDVDADSLLSEEEGQFEKNNLIIIYGVLPSSNYASLAIYYKEIGGFFPRLHMTFSQNGNTIRISNPDNRSWKYENGVSAVIHPLFVYLGEPIQTRAYTSVEEDNFDSYYDYYWYTDGYVIECEQHIAYYPDDDTTLAMCYLYIKTKVPEEIQELVNDKK